MIKRSSSILILICIILFNLSPIAMAADYADSGDISTGTGVLEVSYSQENSSSLMPSATLSTVFFVSLSLIKGAYQCAALK